MKNKEYIWMFLTNIILMLDFTSSTNENGIRVFMGDHFLQEIAQFIVDRQLTILFQRSGVRLILVDGSDKADSLIPILQKISPIPEVVLEQKAKVLNENRKIAPSIVLFFLQDENELQRSIEYLRNLKLLDTATPAVMVKLTQVNDRRKFNVSSILKTAWNSGLLRFLLIYCRKEMKAYTYNPFTNSIIDSSLKTGNDAFLANFKNMQGYLWKVSLFEEWPLLKKQSGNPQKWSGRDFFVLQQTARLLNATFEIVEPAPNTSYQGALRDIKRRKVDFCFVRRFPEKKRNIRFLNTGSLSSLHVIVKKPPFHQKPTAVTLVFQKEIWFFILLSLVVLTATLKRGNQGKFDSFLDIWKILLNISVQTTKRQKYNSMILLLVWIWCSLVLNVSFQCRLIDLMHYPEIEKGIQTLQELERSKLPVYTSYDYVKMQGGTGFLTNQMHLVDYEEVLEVLEDASSNFAVVMPFVLQREKMSLEFFDYIETRGKKILSQELIQSYAVYTFPNFSPFYVPVKLAILRLMEYGIMEKLPYSRFKREFKTYVQSTFKLNMGHVVSAFRFLCIGFSLSAFVFVLEISTGQNRRKNLVGH